MLNYQAILEEIHTSLKKTKNTGEIASYIPELANVPKNKLGIHLQLITGENYSVGDASEKFSIQSISRRL